MLEWIFAGICIAIGFYLAPFIVGLVGLIGAGVISGLMWLVGRK